MSDEGSVRKIQAPNLIMPGVAKCGTTTIYDLLVRHPQITGGIEKEVRYLMDGHEELCPAANVRDCGMDGWMDQYEDRGNGDFTYWLDASPQYQYQQTARDVIGAMDPAPKLIFITRTPSARLFSLYRYARYHQRCLPDHGSFAEFVDAIRPPFDPRLSDQNMMVNAWADTQYDQMLEKWRGAVPEGNIWLTSVEAIAADNDAVVKDMADWLGIDAAPMLNIENARTNPTVRTRSRALRVFGAKLSKILPENALTRRAKNIVKKLNTGSVDGDEKAANADLFKSIDAEFSDHTARFNSMAAKMQKNYIPLPL